MKAPWLAAVISILCASTLLAADSAVRDVTSAHVRLHTDLSANDAKSLAQKLEGIVEFTSDLFGAPLDKPIDCYAIIEESHWPTETFTAEVRAKIQQYAGITVTDVTRNGNQFVSATATSYAFAGNGSPQHEVLHAYLGQQFGVTGPVWFAEGMAEVAQYDVGAKNGVNCPERICQYLRECKTLSLAKIVSADAESGDSWQAYAERWALCHVLLNTPAFEKQFRQYARSVALGKDQPLEKVFAQQWPQLEADFTQFCRAVKPGYRPGQ